MLVEGGERGGGGDVPLDYVAVFGGAGGGGFGGWHASGGGVRGQRSVCHLVVVKSE